MEKQLFVRAQLYFLSFCQYVCRGPGVSAFCLAYTISLSTSLICVSKLCNWLSTDGRGAALRSYLPASAPASLFDISGWPTPVLYVRGLPCCMPAVGFERTPTPESEFLNGTAHGRTTLDTAHSDIIIDCLTWRLHFKDLKPLCLASAVLSGAAKMPAPPDLKVSAPRAQSSAAESDLFNFNVQSQSKSVYAE